jgi:hypothetical protein
MGKPTKQYRFIKDLVFDYVHRTGGQVDYDALTAEVKRHFPASRWQKSHWAWYRCQMTRGRFVNLFSDDEKRRLGAKVQRPAPPSSHSARTSQGSGAVVRGPRAKDDKVKSLGDAILSHVRFVIGLAAGSDEVLRFKINRWVFARLLQDEIRGKRPIKKSLWNSGIRACQGCGKPFHKLKGVEIHRRKGAQGYRVDNCMLVCRDCHEKNPALA